MAILYVQRDEDHNSGSGSSRSFYLLVFAFVFGLTFVPGLPKGVVAGYELKTPALSMPLVLPLARPMYLHRGEAIAVEYDVTVRRGRFTISIANAPNPLMLLFEKPQHLIASTSTTGAGRVTFTAREAGFYLLRTQVDHSGGTPAGCKNFFGDMADAMTAKNSSCPSGNAGYMITIY